MRKVNWLDLIKEFPEIGDPLKQSILTEYFLNVRRRIMIIKNKEILKYMQRSDYNSIKTTFVKT